MSEDLSQLRILIVENEEMNAMLLQLQLEQAGAIPVGPAASVAEALALLASGRPDAAILDFRLAGETSEPVAQALAAAGVPFVVASGVHRDTLPPVFTHGGVLAKPYLYEDLVKVLGAAVRQSAPSGA